jgi:thiamine biosynthesis lipoprotein
MKEFGVKCKLMGSAFELMVADEREEFAKLMLEEGIKEIRRIEELLSEFIPTSITSAINQYDRIQPLPVTPEFYALIERCIGISSLTDGCFDISVSPLKKLYSFRNEDFTMPSRKLINEALDKVGYRKISLHKESSSISFTHPGMQISFSAIGKGYASDRVKQLWLNNGVKSGFINASGDLNAFGSRPDGSQWKIGIANPSNRNQVLMHIPLHNASAATSGDYEQHFIYRNNRYSHNLNPFTGLPLSGIQSVTVFSPGAELSDALATAVYVKGIMEGIKFINQLPQTHCIIIDDRHQVHFSKNLEYETIPC